MKMENHFEFQAKSPIQEMTSLRACRDAELVDLDGLAFVLVLVVVDAPDDLAV